MRTLVLGAGATGGYFGGRLAQAGRDVTFLVRPRRAAALRERGLRLTGLGREETITPHLVTASSIPGPYDLVLLSVKASALAPAMDDLAPAVGPATTIVPFLNGMAHLDTLNQRFGAGAVLGGVVWIVATMSEDGDVVRLAPPASLTIGEQEGGRSPRLQRVQEALDGAGFDLILTDDIIAAMWYKWVYITTVGALTCLMRGTVGEIVAVPGGADLARALLAETSAVAAAAGFPLPVAESKRVEEMVTDPGSTLTASMYRDVIADRTVEVEEVFADLAARARARSIATPLLDLATMNLRVHQHRLRA
jgi:2-dehydropantoate 2-reductase